MTIIPYPVTPNTIYNWDASTLARTMRGCGFKVNCVVTSPPYYGLRDYGVDGQIGLEPTPDEYVTALVGLFREIRQVLSDDGTVWLNLGDTYAANRGYQVPDSKWVDVGNSKSATVPNGLKPKDLIGIPWRVALALQADGWWLRSDIIWAKGNPMPESVTDRPTKAHEYVFLLAKSASYYYDADAIREPHTTEPWGKGENGSIGKPDNGWLGQNASETSGWFRSGRAGNHELGRNKRTVWTVNTAPFSGAHFATFPPALITPMILAGCPETVCAVCGKPHVRMVERETNWQERREAGAWAGNVGVSDTYQNGVHGKGMSHDLNTKSVRDLGFAPTCSCSAATRPGVVFDPFMGAGTTALVSRQHGRAYVGSEINPQYVAIAQERLRLPFEQHYIGQPSASLADLPLFMEQEGTS